MIPRGCRRAFRKCSPAILAPARGVAACLARIGLKLSDISQIVISHMHWDHGGGLELFSGLPAAKKVLAGERDYAFGLTVTHRDSETVFAGGGYFKEHFEIPGISFDLVDPALGDFELAPGLEVVQFEGHTPQILGLVVHLPKSGTVILPSDAVYMKRNIFPTVSPPSIIYDSLGFQRSAQKMRMLIKKYDARVVYPHDPDQMSDVKVMPEYYD